MFKSAVVSLVLVASALANVYLTSPVSSTSWPSGQTATISWQDDGNSPSLAQFGSATFGLYVGNAISQTELQPIASAINVSSISSITWTPQPSIGENGQYYFIRVTSESYTAPGSQYPQEAFSAEFALTGMSGTFNSSVQAEINGQSTAPIGGSTTAASSSTASASSSSLTSAAPSLASSASSAPLTSASAATPSASTSTSGAGKPAIATGFVALAAALVGASLL